MNISDLKTKKNYCKRVGVIIFLYVYASVRELDDSNSVEVNAEASWKPLPGAITCVASIPITYKTKWLKNMDKKGRKRFTRKGILNKF